MGVANLWAELQKYRGAYQQWSGALRSGVTAGEMRDDTAQIVDEVCGRVLAIDLSVWLFQSSQQNDLKESIFDEHARVLYIILFRIINLLRYGATPVFVLEGETPDAKYGRLAQRSLAKGLSGSVSGNRRGGRHDALGRKVVELLDLMGIPHVDAPGEAEAMCAALTAVGLADGAVTSDVDALLFGATHVYRECRLLMDNPKLNCLERIDATEAALRCFGIRGGGNCVNALQAVACLSGCDYSVSGGKGIGVKSAMEAVQLLTQGRQDDSHVIPELMRYLETGPDPRVTVLTKCTGCKTCGHEKHGRQPCHLCGSGPCKPKPASEPCVCEFHRSEPQRKFMRVISKAAGTGPSFLDDCRTALEAFRSETERARRTAEQLRSRGNRIIWSRRPDVSGVFQLMFPLLGHTGSDPEKLIWTYGEVRDKLRPALLEWDMRQGPEPSAAVRPLVEFRPRRIKQVAAKDGGTWAYIMEFDRIPTVNAADAHFDTSQLASSKLTKGRHVRQTIIRRQWPHLLQQKEEEELNKQQAKPKKGRGKTATAGAAIGNGAGGSGALGSPGGTSGSGRTAATASTATGAGGRGGGRTAATTAQSVGSSDVMYRFLRRAGATAEAGTGAEGPTTSVQQPPPPHQQPPYQQPPPQRLGTRGIGSDRYGTIDAAAASGDGEDEYDDMDFQVTQQNVGEAVGTSGRGMAGAGAVAPPTGGLGATGGAAAGPAGGCYQGASAGAGGLVPLWRDDDDDGDDGDDKNGAAAGGGEGQGGTYGAVASGRRSELYDDLDDVIPASLDELLAGAGTSQAAGESSAGPLWQLRQQQRLLRKQDELRKGSKAMQEKGAGGTAAAAAAAAAAGPSSERPFCPQPTGPGPGRSSHGAAAAGAGAGGGRPAPAPRFGLGDGPAAVVGARIAPSQDPAVVPQRDGGGGGISGVGCRTAAGIAAVEVLDLTDSPAVAARPGTAVDRRSAAATTTATAGDHDDGSGGGDVVAAAEEDGQEEAEEGYEQAVGSAVKPSARKGAIPAVANADPATAAAGSAAAEGGPRAGGVITAVAPQQAPASPQHEPAQQQPFREDAAARRALLQRTLFPDRPPPSPLEGGLEPPRKKGREEALGEWGQDGGGGGGGGGGSGGGSGGGALGGVGGSVGARRVAAPAGKGTGLGSVTTVAGTSRSSGATGQAAMLPQLSSQPQHQQQGAGEGEGGAVQESPLKRRNIGTAAATGRGGGGGAVAAAAAGGIGAGYVGDSSGCGCGGGDLVAGGKCSSAVGAATATAAAAAAAADHVDLTLDDDDDNGEQQQQQEEEEGAGRGLRGQPLPVGKRGLRGTCQGAGAGASGAAAARAVQAEAAGSKGADAGAMAVQAEGGGDDDDDDDDDDVEIVDLT